MVFPTIRQVVYRLVYYEHIPKSNKRVSPRKYCLSTKLNSITSNHDDRFFPYRSEETIMNQCESSEAEKQEAWWEFCPICGFKLLNHKCRFVCSNPRCHFFMSCSEFDM
jgi:hypothetical protein